MHVPPARVLMPTLETIELGSLESEFRQREPRIKDASRIWAKYNVTPFRDHPRPEADQIVPSNNIMEEAGISEFRSNPLRSQHDTYYKHIRRASRSLDHYNSLQINSNKHMFSEFESWKWWPCYTHQLMRDLETFAVEAPGVQSRSNKQGRRAERWLNFDTKVVHI